MGSSFYDIRDRNQSQTSLSKDICTFYIYVYTYVCMYSFMLGSPKGGFNAKLDPGVQPSSLDSPTHHLITVLSSASSSGSVFQQLQVYPGLSSCNLRSRFLYEDILLKELYPWLSHIPGRNTVQRYITYPSWGTSCAYPVARKFSLIIP